MTTSPPASRPLEGRVALVTGAASPSGMGNAICRALVARGARVAMIDSNSGWLPEGLRQVEAVGGGGCAVPILADVSDPDAAARAVDATIDAFGGLQVLVNNAGTTPRALGLADRSCNAWEVSVEAWQRVVSVNLNGAFHMIRAAVPHLLAQGFGRVIGVTTSLSTMVLARATPYGPSKAGHEALVAALARELDGSGVTANVLVPGGRTNTHFFAGRSDGERSGLLPADVLAPPAAWLASDESAIANGMRIVASRWDESLPIDARLAVAASPAAWPSGDAGGAAA